VLGAMTTIQTLDGEIEIQLEPGLQSGDVITIKGKGVNHLRHSGRGDLLITLHVKTPTKLDGKQKELFRSLAGLRKADKIELVKQTHGRFSSKRRG